MCVCHMFIKVLTYLLTYVFIYFSKQTFIDMNNEIKVDISCFNQDIKQNIAICQNAEKPTKYLVNY